MNVSTTIPPTVHVRRSRLVGLVCLVGAVAAGATWAALAFGGDNGGGQTQPNVSAPPIITSSPIPMTGYQDAFPFPPTVVPKGQDYTGMPISGGTGFATTVTWPTSFSREAVLSSLSPSSRQYVEQLLKLTPAQLAAGAAGQP